MTVARSTGAKAKCDKLFSRIIRFHGVCERCGYQCPWECDSMAGSHRQGCKMQCAHIITRHISATRCDLRNAFSLCAKCHYHLGLWPIEMSDFTLDKKDRATYDALKRLAESKPPTNWNTTYAELEREWERLRSEFGLA